MEKIHMDMIINKQKKIDKIQDRCNNKLMNIPFNQIYAIYWREVGGIVIFL